MSLDRRRLLIIGAGAIGAGTVGLTATGCGASGLGLGGSGDAGGSGNSGGGWESATCVLRGTLDRHTTLAGRPLVYEVNQRRSPFWFDAGFHARLESWHDRFVTTSKIETPDQIWTYGSWTDGGDRCDSWHHSGRAFDLSRLRRSGQTLVSCRYDQWRDSAEALTQRRRYWALAASLHQDFAYVLTYLYNGQHHNHIHVDNGRSGAGPSTFRTRSAVQVQAVQAICRYLWDVDVELTGRWDAATRRAQRRVLDTIAVPADLDASADSWRAFLTASTARFDGD